MERDGGMDRGWGVKTKPGDSWYNLIEEVSHCGELTMRRLRASKVRLPIERNPRHSVDSWTDINVTQVEMRLDAKL